MNWVNILWGWGVLYYMNGGVASPSVSSLNEHLRKYSYPLVPEAYISHSSGWRGFFAGYTLSAFRGGIIGGSATYNDKIVSIDGEYGYYSFGRLLTLKNGLFYFHPSLGFGRSKMILTVGDNVANFDSLLSSPGQISTLTSTSWILTPELEFLWRKDFFLFLGLRFGYLVAFPKGNWSMGGVSGIKGPSTAMDGPYVNLFLSLGYVKL